MHIPNPLGGYPLVLRDSSEERCRKGELLYDYNNNDLYYVNKQSGEKNLLAKDIYNKIIATRLENSYIEIIDSSNLGERTMNHWFMNITKSSPISD